MTDPFPPRPRNRAGVTAADGPQEFDLSGIDDQAAAVDATLEDGDA